MDSQGKLKPRDKFAVMKELAKVNSRIGQLTFANSLTESNRPKLDLIKANKEADKLMEELRNEKV